MTVNNDIRRAKEEHRNRLMNKLEDTTTASRQNWNIMKQMKGNKVDSSIPILNDDNTHYTTAEEKANLMGTYFASQFQSPVQVFDTMLKRMTNERILTDIQTTDEEVLAVLRQLKTHKGDET